MKHRRRETRVKHLLTSKTPLWSLKSSSNTTSTTTITTTTTGSEEGLGEVFQGVQLKSLLLLYYHYYY